jgi:branched-subunit amino acid ABC-type transport system permease component
MSLPASNSAPITAHIGIQLLVAIGLPMIVLPIAACIIYFPVRHYLRKRAARKEAVIYELGLSIELNGIGQFLAGHHISAEQDYWQLVPKADSPYNSD